MLKYSHSIMEEFSDSRCWLCGADREHTKLDRHEIFHGSYRKKSAELGMWLTLCHECHMRLHFIDPGIDKQLKRACQKIAMYLNNWDVDAFRKEFGKNYLKERESVNDD